MITLRDYQQQGVNDAILALQNQDTNKKIVFECPTGGGKCLAENTPVLMFDGSIKMSQNVKVGDLLMGDDSTPRYVKSTCIGNETMYRITPTKGDAWGCNESHILSLRYTDTGAVRNITVRDYLQLSKTQKHRLKLYRTGVQFAPQDIAIDAWLFGLWLADGTKTNGSTQITVNCDDIEIIEHLKSIGSTFERDRLKNCYICTLSFAHNPNGNRSNSNIYRDEFRRCLNNGDHHDIGIPRNYLINSRENRLQLLAGLLDGDGYFHNGVYEITTKYPRLRDEILYLCRSLGFAAYSSNKDVDISKLKESVNADIRTYYRISISGELSVLPMKLKRKKAPIRRQKKNVLNTGFKVENIGDGTYYGFELEGNNRLFLLGDFTVTHNTVIFSYIVQRAMQKGSRTLILTDRDELLRGTGGTLAQFGVNTQYIKAGRRTVPDGQTFVAMAQTLKKRIDKEPWAKWLQGIDLVIIDECHKQEFNLFFERDLFEGKTVIGFSATPKRGGKMRQLGFDYADIVHTKTVVDLIEMGHLMPDMYFGSSLAPDMKGVAMNTKGDYSESDMFKRYDTPKLYGGVIEAYQTHTPNTIAIVFCTSILHCVRTCKEFEAKGIKARYLASSKSKPQRPDGEEPTDKAQASVEWVKYWQAMADYQEISEAYRQYSGPREKLINEWKRGDFQVMINAGILTTGFDFPAIETVILFRATVSEVLYLQMLGRGSRPSPGTHKTHFNILDFGRNAERLGGYKLPRKWHLFHKSSKGGGVPPVKECDPLMTDENSKVGCGDYILASAKICPSCGFIFPKPKEIENIELELLSENLSSGKMELTKPVREMSYDELEAFAKYNKYKAGWINVQLVQRGGLAELENYARHKGYARGWVTRMKSFLPKNLQ